MLTIEPVAQWRPGQGGSDADHLRELAARCRSVARLTGDPAELAALREMALTYETFAQRLEQ